MFKRILAFISMQKFLYKNVLELRNSYFNDLKSVKLTAKAFGLIYT